MIYGVLKISRGGTKLLGPTLRTYMCLEYTSLKLTTSAHMSGGRFMRKGIIPNMYVLVIYVLTAHNILWQTKQYALENIDMLSAQ